MDDDDNQGNYIDLLRGRRQENDATRWYQNTIQNQAPAYFRENDRDRRRGIVTGILNEMNSEGYRFRWNGMNDTGSLNEDIVEQSFYYVLHNDQQRNILVQEGIATRDQIDQWRRDNPMTDIGQGVQWANDPNNLDPAIATHYDDDIRGNLRDFVGGNDDTRRDIVIEIAGLDEMRRRRRIAQDLIHANQRINTSDEEDNEYDNDSDEEEQEDQESLHDKGNEATVWYQNTIQNLVHAYSRENDRDRRRGIVTDIINEINTEGYRFLWDYGTKSINEEMVRQSFYYVLHNDQQRDIIVQEGIATHDQIDQLRRENPMPDPNNPINLDQTIAIHHLDEIREYIPVYFGDNSRRDDIETSLTSRDENRRRKTITKDLEQMKRKKDGGGENDGDENDREEDQSGNDNSNEENNDHGGDGNDGGEHDREEDQSGNDNSNDENNDEEGGNDGNDNNRLEDQSGIVMDGDVMHYLSGDMNVKDTIKFAAKMLFASRNGRNAGKGEKSWNRYQKG